MCKVYINFMKKIVNRWEYEHTKIDKVSRLQQIIHKQTVIINNQITNTLNQWQKLNLKQQKIKYMIFLIGSLWKYKKW